MTDGVPPDLPAADALVALQQRVRELEAELAAVRTEAPASASLHRDADLATDQSVLRTLIDTTDAAVVVRDRDGRIVLANKTAAALYGVEVGDLIGHIETDFAPSPEGRAQISAFLADDREVIASRRTKRIAADQLTMADGTVRWFHPTKTPISLPGHPDCVLVVAIDITERKQAEADLRASEARYRSYVDQAPNGVFVADSHGHTIDVNPAACHLTGYSREELIGMNLAELLPEDALEIGRQHLQRVKEDGYARGDVPVLHKDGTHRLWHIAASRLQNGHYLGFVTDASAEHAAQQALTDSEARYRLLAENISDVIWLLNADGLFTYISPSVERIVGYTPDELREKPLVDFLPEEARPFLEAKTTAILGTLRGPRSRNQAGASGPETAAASQERFDLPVVARGGQIVHLEILMNPLFDQDGVCTGMLGVARDITERRRVEEALKETEERFSLFMEHLPGAVSIKDGDGYLRFCNRLFAAAAGKTPDQIIGKQSEAYTDPGSADAFEQENRLVLDRDSALLSEHSYPGPDGLSHWLTVKFPIPRANRRPLLGAISLDITDHKAAEAALAESETRFRLAAESMSDLIYEWDIATGELRWFGDIDGALGYATETFPRNRAAWLDHVHPEDRARLARATSHRAAGPDLIDERYRIRHTDGTWLTWQDRGRPITDEAGRPTRWIGACVDITEMQRNAEERERLLSQVQAQARRTQQIIDTVPQGVLLLNAAGEVLLSNPEGKRNLQALADTDSTGPVRSLGRRRLLDILEAPDKGPAHEIQANEQIFELAARPMVEAGGTSTAWVLVIRDVTEERESRRRSQLQERLATVGQLAAGIAHDFNNVMAVIVLYAQMLAQKRELDVQGRRYVQTITDQAHHATRLISQILDFSRTSDLQRRALDLGALVREGTKLWERTLPESITLHIHQKEKPLFVRGEATRLNQMLTNLALNARDAMPHGGELHVGLERVDVRTETAPIPDMQPGPWVKIVVRDTGVGISEDALPHIYDPFFTTKERGKGNGLGLAQVYGIVEAHEGYIDVETEVGTGTAFLIYLPATENPETCEGSDADQTTGPTGRGEHLLVVEDNAFVRDALISTLEGLNYRVTGVENGSEALGVLSASRSHGDMIRLVVSDMVMPEMGGADLLRAIHERGYPVRVILLTGYAIEDLGSLDYPELIAWQHKPPDVSQLAETIAQGLQTPPLVDRPTD